MCCSSMRAQLCRYVRLPSLFATACRVLCKACGSAAWLPRSWRSLALTRRRPRCTSSAVMSCRSDRLASPLRYSRSSSAASLLVSEPDPPFPLASPASSLPRLVLDCQLSVSGPQRYRRPMPRSSCTRCTPKMLSSRTAANFNAWSSRRTAPRRRLTHTLVSCASALQLLSWVAGLEGVDVAGLASTEGCSVLPGATSWTTWFFCIGKDYVEFVTACGPTRCEVACALAAEYIRLRASGLLNYLFFLQPSCNTKIKH
ncbi:hypothetical protein V8C86DRAFT_2456362, partial [Haematococcus lacustris]